jgi:hypothetical protein
MLISAVRFLNICLPLLLLTLVWSPNIAKAQRQVVVQDTFNPAFQIEPLVQRISGRRGEVLHFQFTLQTINQDTDIEILKVGLRQDITGQILQDERGSENNPIEILGETKVHLTRDIPYVIEGLVKVPEGDANFHALGILVRDNGVRKERQPDFDLSGKAVTKAGIRFVTNYVLRVDLDVSGARGEQAKSLVLEEGRISPYNGLPKVSVIVRNPANTAFEYQMRTHLRSSPSDHTFNELRMVMPVRAAMESEERYVGRVLPGCSVRMEEMLPQNLLSGKYQLEVELIADGRAINRRTFSIEVDSEDFPAQEVRVKQAGGGIYVSPAQIELSQARGGQRRLGVEFKNTSSAARTITLAAVNAQGTPLTNLVVQPESFTLSAGRSRKVSLTLRTKSNVEQPVEFGTLQIKSTDSTQQFAHTGSVPLAIILGQTKEPKLSLQPLRFVADAKYPCFRTMVTNQGLIHAPLDAKLLIASESGQRRILTGGFGKWLLPGESANLEFRLDRELSAGNYQIVCELENGQEPIVKKQAINVTDFENAKPAK